MAAWVSLSRPGTGDSERTSVDINAVITDVFSLLEHQFEVGSIKIRRELSAFTRAYVSPPAAAFIETLAEHAAL